MSNLFDFDQQPDEYAVMGNPISHSKSPAIHAAFAEQTSQSIRYRAIQVDPGGFDQAVGNFFANGGKGLNVTVPFKEEAWKLVGKLSERARLAGAVNTIKPADKAQLFGDNTDGAGLVRDLTENLGAVIAGKRLLLLGAGGAARGVLFPLLEQQPALLVLANRTASRAKNLVRQFTAEKNIGDKLDAAGFEELEDKSFDIVINATSASLDGSIPSMPASAIKNAEIVYDMMYSRDPTPFLQWAQKNGACKISDGLGMLVEQAAESFFIWRNLKPQTIPVIQMIREQMTQGH